MKKTFLTMAAAIAMVSCSQDDLLENESYEDNQAIAFESYLGKSVQSRAAVVTTETLKVDGFAVNAYYTKEATFNADNASSYEKFMNNTKVTFNKEKGEWTYSPVKYWPNNASDKISFFAYAPYGDDNITVKADDFSKIDFTVNDDVLEQVDFIYNDQKTDTNKTIDLIKPDVKNRVQFLFKHALARIGFSVQVVVDETDENSSLKLDGNTHINVKKVELLDKDGNETAPFYTTGTFDLAEGDWGTTPTGSQGFTFEGANFDRTITVDGKEVVQLHKFNQKQTLLNEKSYLMIIPQNLSTDGFNIRITYDVITEGEDGKDNSIVNNVITSKDALQVDFKDGKAYNFNLILGMTSVKFDAEVADWGNGTADTDTIWLPLHTETNKPLIHQYNQSNCSVETSDGYLINNGY